MNTIFLTGRIDSNNAGEWEKKIIGDNLIFDASELEYISSAGLRVLMKARRKSGRKINIINVSREVYDIFETTGFTELFNVKKALRKISVEGCEEIGSGSYGRVYRIDSETIAKIYNPGINLDFVQRERDTAQKVFLLGVPTAISYDVIQCGDSYGTLYELLNAKTVAQIISENRERIPEMGKKCAQLLKQLHNIKVEQDSNLPSRKVKLSNLIKSLAAYLTPEESNKILAFIDTVPDRKTFLHGDFNAKNIMVGDNGEFQLIDLGDAAYGHPLWDIAGMIIPYVHFVKTAPLSVQEKSKMLAFNCEDAPIFWSEFCKEYFTFKTQQEIETFTEKFMIYSYLIHVVFSINYAGDNKELKQRAINSTVRGELLPAIEKIKDFSFINEYFES